MALHLTPEMLETCYELLRTTPPFRGWKLPHADEVMFGVGRDFNIRGWHLYESGRHSIFVSQSWAESLREILPVMAHEMIHVRGQMRKIRNYELHGAWFQQYADQVCKVHLFDRKAF